MSLLIVQLAVIFIPGIIWTKIDDQFGTGTTNNQLDFLVNSFVFGLVSYIFVYLIYDMFDWNFELLSLSSNRNESGDAIFLENDFFDEIFAGVVSGLFLSIIWLYAKNFKIITRLLQQIRATKRFGDEDVWDFIFNSSSAVVEYVHFRDFEKELVYGGWVKAFSETGEIRELSLANVAVYDFQGNELYTVPLLYLARDKDQITIEFPAKGAK